MDFTDKITVKVKCPFCKMTYEQEQELSVVTRYDEPDDIHIHPIDPELEELCQLIP